MVPCDVALFWTEGHAVIDLEDSQLKVPMVNVSFG